tara:strand:+ start:42 stop:1556 length:1515 start_codon:yes stop_codon:yes gene_type:complete
MATRYPLVIDTTDNNKIKEIPSGDNLNLTGNSIVNAINVTASGVLSGNSLVLDTTSATFGGQALQTVAFTGQYNDLSGAPTPFTGSYNDLTERPILKDTIESLDNVDNATPDDGDVLQYNATLGRYVAQPASAVAVSSANIQDLANVAVTTLSANQILKWNGVNFVNGSISYSEITGTPSNITEVNDDTTPQLGGDLDTNGNNITFADGNTTSNRISFGDGADLKIFHNGSHSIIRETGVGSLYLQSDTNVILSSDSGTKVMVKGIASGATELYHNDVKKFETTADGVSITGSIGSSGNIELDPDGSNNVVFKGNATKGAGQFVLNCENNSHGITVKGPPHSAGANYTLTLPNTDGNADQVLKTDGSGNLDWTDNSSSLANFTFSTGIMDTDDSSHITITPAVIMQSDLTVQNDITVNNDLNVLGSLNTVGSGTPEIFSDNEIELNAGTRIQATTGPFQMLNATNAQRDALTPANGDMIYNTDDNRFQVYQNGSWLRLDTSPIV